MNLAAPRVSLCGASAVLLDAEGPLSLPTQERIWSLSERVRDLSGVLDTHPGMNSLLVLLDPLAVDADAFAAELLKRWADTRPGRVRGRTIEMGVVYGGERGIDMPDFAAFHGLSPKEVAELHAAPEYVVFAPGTGPGFGFLFGLDPRLFTPRRQVPVMRPVGSNISIGGGQAGLGTPQRPGVPAATAPTGWHVIGHVPDAPVPFDLNREPPFLLALGDRIRFRIESVVA
nr:allophanate hydrolase subunit 1 [Bosea sp. F3-2]